MNFVLDASVALAWAFEDERSGDALAALDRLSESEAVTPALWSLEVVNGLLTAERRGRISGHDANRFAALLLELPIVVDPPERRRPFESVRHLARSHHLTAYDTAYLELALRLGLPLATLDRGLAQAASDAGVRLLGG